MDDSPRTPYIKHITDQFMVIDTKVTEFVTSLNQWNINTSNNILPKEITSKTKAITIPITNIKIKWLTTKDDFSIKQAAWANNDQISFHTNLKL